MVRYGIVSIYPLFIKISKNKPDKVLELRNESFDQDMQTLPDELFEK